MCASETLCVRGRGIHTILSPGDCFRVARTYSETVPFWFPMTTYFRNVRSDFLEDMSLSPDAFRVLAYMIAQKPGFTFNLGHLQRVFGGVIGLNRLKVARRDLIAGGWLIPGQRRKVAGGQIAQDGAVVNWAKVCLPSSDRRSGNQTSGDQTSGDQTYITKDERTREDEPSPAEAGRMKTSTTADTALVSADASTTAGNSSTAANSSSADDLGASEAPVCDRCGDILTPDHSHGADAFRPPCGTCGGYHDGKCKGAPVCWTCGKKHQRSAPCQAA